MSKLALRTADRFQWFNLLENLPFIAVIGAGEPSPTGDVDILLFLNLSKRANKQPLLKLSPKNKNNSNESKIGNDGSGYRTKATFIKRPQDPEDERMEKLYEIRPHRRIEKEDMDKIWPDWTPELF